MSEIPDSTELAVDLYQSLKEVMMWIRNWDPNFIHDEEWPETEEKAEAALKAWEG